MQTNTTGHKQSLYVWNPTTRPLTLFLEPWAETFILEPDSGFDLVGEGPVEGRFEVSVRENGLTVYGWTGSVIEVFQDGATVEPFIEHSRSNGTNANDSPPAQWAPHPNNQR